MQKACIIGLSHRAITWISYDSMELEAVNGLAYDDPQNVVEDPFAEHHQQIPDFNGIDIQGPNYVNIKRTVAGKFHAQHSNEQRVFRWKPE